MTRKFRISASLAAFVFMAFIISGCKWPFSSKTPTQEVAEEVDENPIHGASDEPYEENDNQGDDEDMTPEYLENEAPEETNEE